jgi:hypothetical protein
MNATDEIQEQWIRERELEIFEAFTTRALEIVKGEKESLADACRLTDTALKAVRGEGLPPGAGPSDGDGVARLIEELNRAYDFVPHPQSLSPRGTKEAGVATNTDAPEGGMS